MDIKTSKLSGSGCDFVVATTQASINSNMLEYLGEGTQPIQYIFILYDNNLNPTVQVNLEQIQQMTGVNPFDIPEGTQSSDPRLQALNDAMFYVGIKVQMGLPQGVDPKQLPPVVKLESADRVQFNLFCSQATVVQLKTVGRRSAWSVYNQPTSSIDNLWTIHTTVNLVVADLDKNLDGSTYLKNNPQIKQQLKDSLLNLSGTAFSLQQLLFDLDSAILEDGTGFQGVKDPEVQNLLNSFFLLLHKKTASEHGLPLVAVTAVSHEPDPSSLHMTGFERTVTKVDANDGAATTLNYLCAINNHQVPSRYTHFDWNWMRPEDVNQESGVISISRDILVKHIADKLQIACAASCYKPVIGSDSRVIMVPGQTPPAKLSPTGSKVINFYSDLRDRGSMATKYWDGRPRTMMVIACSQYSCDVSFSGKSILVEQTLEVWACYNPDANDCGATTSPVHCGRSDEYEMSADQNGSLQLTLKNSSTWDKADHRSAAPSKDGDYDSFRILNQIFRDQISALCEGNMHGFQIGQLESFVFPGAKTFTYKDPFFSDNQDLICEITYVDPVKVSPSQEPQPQPAAPQPATQADTEGPPSSTPTGNVGKLTGSSELMRNYLQGEIISPAGKFEALQRCDGHTLLFAIDSSGIFHVIEEQTGTSHTGWQVHDLSTAAIQALFPGQDATIRSFDVAENAADGTIGLMMTLQLNGNDHLVVSLGNPSGDTHWMADPAWTLVPFDSVDEQPQKIVIANTLFAETVNRSQYLVVDIDRPDNNTTGLSITRYHIDMARSAGCYWVKHDTTVDIAAGQYQSVVGRISGKPGDGIYTAGSTGGAPQLIYEPIINYYGNGPVSPRRLRLPGGAIPSAITTARRPDGSTDLYALGNSTLYLFPSDAQNEDTEPLAVFNGDVLAGSETLRAMTHDGVTTVWGRNSSDQVYYLACATSRLSEPSAWSTPIPILSQVERISAYVNRADGGNTIFASGDGRLQKLMQGSAATGRIWRSQEITLAAPPTQKSISFMSYTTTIHATQMEMDLPATNTVVNLSANSRTPVYINGIYHVLSPTPMHVATDASGTLTVVEMTDSLHGAIVTASFDNTSLTINPMDASSSKLTALDSADKLRTAKIHSAVTAGGVVGSPQLTSLISSSVSDDDVNAVAQNLGLLKDAYDGLTNPGKQIDETRTSEPQVYESATAGTLPGADTRVVNYLSWGDIGRAFDGFIHTIDNIADMIKRAFSSIFGDIWHWVKHEAEKIGGIFRDAVTGTLHFFAKIGGQIYHAVMDSFHAVVAGLEWVFDKVKVVIQDVVKFCEMLLGWDDIRRTKDVMHNTIKLWMQNQVDYIPKARDTIDKEIKALEGVMNEWTGITNWPSLGDVSQKPASHSASNPNQNQTSSSKSLANHYQTHAGQLSIIGDSPTIKAAEQLISDLVTAISNEGIVLVGVFNQLTQLAKDFASLTVEQVLQRIAGIMVDGVLSSVQVVADVLLTILYDVAQSAIGILDAKIHIPVISDILNAIGVSDISFLDLLCWIAAVGFTVVYKIVEKCPPFPAHEESVQTILAAGAWHELENVLLHPTLPKAVQKAFFKACHGSASFMSVVGNPVTSAEAYSEAGTGGVIGKGATVFKIVVAVCQSAGDLLVPQDPLQNKGIKTISTVTSALKLLSSIYFSGTVQSQVGKLGFGSLSVDNSRGIGALVGAILVPIKLTVSGWHFYELTKDNAGNTRSAAILGEVSNLASCVSVIAYAIVVNDEDPDTRLIAVTAKAICDDAFAGLQVAETIVGCP
ncbi:hypothetical protein BGZ63DRAFT_222139 [Mariannaea sp. PMI_226]|nr:hypothetical protein BGZ63DRAFT_222139 [Mariannaea sp. PMI_226]